MSSSRRPSKPTKTAIDVTSVPSSSSGSKADQKARQMVRAYKQSTAPPDPHSPEVITAKVTEANKLRKTIPKLSKQVESLQQTVPAYKVALEKNQLRQYEAFGEITGLIPQPAWIGGTLAKVTEGQKRRNVDAAERQLLTKKQELARSTERLAQLDRDISDYSKSLE